MSKALSLLKLGVKLTDWEIDLTRLSTDEQFSLLESRSREIMDPGRLREQLLHSKQTGRPLRIKYGIDPTAQEIHLGHIVPIVVARRFLRMGHHVIIVIGDFTAFIGDPTGRLTARPILTTAEIASNVAHYKTQIGKFIDLSKIEVVFNSRFYEPGAMTVLDLFKVFRQNSVAPLLQREDFRQRKEAGLTIPEMLYTTLMAIDSIKLEAQVELGGIDQLLNFQIAKTFMKRAGIEPETAVTTELLESTAGDGKKMSKSEGNYVSLTASAEEIYGKIMSIPDRLMEHYFKLLTDISDRDWEALEIGMREGGLSPKEVKQLLARVIVTWIHDIKAAQVAEEKFTRIFSRRELPEDLQEKTVAWRPGLTWTDIITDLGLAKSRSEFRRLTKAGSVKLMTPDEKTLLDAGQEVNLGEFVLKYGRGKFIRLIIKQKSP